MSKAEHCFFGSLGGISGATFLLILSLIMDKQTIATHSAIAIFLCFFFGLLMFVIWRKQMSSIKTLATSEE